MNRTWLVLITGFIVLGLGLGTLWLTKENTHYHETGALYYCPMHPQITSDKPGECPICHMKLVKRETPPERHAASTPRNSSKSMVKDHASVVLTQEQQHLIGVKTDKVRSRKLVKTIRATGTIAHDLVKKPIRSVAFMHENDLPFIQVGSEAELEAPGLPGEVFKGRVRKIDRMVEAQTRTVKAHIQMEHHKAHLKPGMIVSVKIRAELKEALAVPQEAVLDTGTEKIVFVDQGEGNYEPRLVTTGTTADGFYEIKEGLKAGEDVVTSANFLIDSESRMKAVLESSMEENQGGHSYGQ